MSSVSSALASFLHTYQVGKATFHFSEKPSAALLDSVNRWFKQPKSKSRKRISGPLLAGKTRMFAKSQLLESFKARWRVTRGRQTADGRYDWAVEELHNTLAASQRGIPSPAVVGFGYIRRGLGLVQETLLLIELLDGYIDGQDWLEQNPDRVQWFVEQALELLLHSNAKGIYHLDFSALNIMLNEQADEPMKVIDMENCFVGTTHFPAETLAFQMGFLYRRGLYKFITEADYDRLIYEVIDAEKVDRERFDGLYGVCKHEVVGRKERRKVFLEGQLN
ncbi:lipopolysaccharide kinase InaA family protein [Pseudomonas sp. NPDC089734]|uniref:lipopolysaccharide kinase InaA family protein n=1 Tax=Pseudomonas sp. NPDC089734 TaxID=3364469 RepID=UPI0037F93EF0